MKSPTRKPFVLRIPDELKIELENEVRARSQEAGPGRISLNSMIEYILRQWLDQNRQPTFRNEAPN